jgi:RNA polymerase sigma-70 factor (ECF subfamily)
MVAVASRYVASRSTAEDVVQDTWVAVLRGLDRFEGRSSLRTWVFRILLNRARTTGVAERRVVPFSDAFPNRDDVADSDADYPGRASDTEGVTPEDAVISAELRGELGAAVSRLPNRQRAVVLLRDVHGYPAQDVCRLLGVSSGNQRLLLHRGRAQLRTVLQGCSSR